MSQTVINLHSKEYTEEVIRPAMDVAYVETPGGEVKTISSSAWTENLGTPIGVVVIPKDFLPDGKARVMAMYSATSAGTRDEASNVRIPWGGFGRDIPDLDNLNEAPVIDFNTNTLRRKGYGYLPSDYFTRYPNPWDFGTGYYYDPTDSYYRFAPSPYGPDGALNPLYIATEYSGGSINNCLADFNGKENTDILVGFGEDYTAANAARNYKSYDGDTLEWYLPTMGELGFVCARLKVIGEALVKIGGLDLALLSYAYWSSSEYNSTYINRMVLYKGALGNDSKGNTNYVRPFALL